MPNVEEEERGEAAVNLYEEPSDETRSLFPVNGVVEPAVVPPVGDDDGDEVFAVSPRRKRQKRTSSPVPFADASVESRRGFQKLWTDADEVTILEGFLEFTSRRGTTHADYQHDTGQFCDQIKGRLQLHFNGNQIIEKLRRLKKKYRNMAARMADDDGFAFRSAHDRVTFAIASKIWSPTYKGANRPLDASDALVTPNPPESLQLYDDSAAADGAVFDSTLSLQEMMETATWSTVPVQSAKSERWEPVPSLTAAPTMDTSEMSVERTEKSCILAPFHELLEHDASGGVTANPVSPFLLRPGVVPPSSSSELDRKWKQQRILEMEVYLKRLDLVHEQVSLKLEMLRSERNKKNNKCS